MSILKRAVGSVAQIPVKLIELFAVGPMITVMAFQESTLDDKGVFGTYMKIWRKIVTGSDKKPHFPLAIGQWVLAYLTSPIGIPLHLMVLALMADAMGHG